MTILNEDARFTAYCCPSIRKVLTCCTSKQVTCKGSFTRFEMGFCGKAINNQRLTCCRYFLEGLQFGEIMLHSDQTEKLKAGQSGTKSKVDF